jgi:hypothetical protein
MDSRRVITLRPQDEASQDPDLLVFRRKLLAASVARDWDALKELMHNRVGFGPEYFDAKRSNFGYFWRVHEPDSRLWWKLTRALQWGGRFVPGDLFACPGLDWPAEFDPKRFLVAAGEDVPLLAAPRREAQVNSRLAYHIVEQVPMPGMEHVPFDENYPYHNNWEHHGQHGYCWDDHLHVRTLEGEQGYVYCRNLISPLEHQVYLKRIEGGRWWAMMAFYAPGSEIVQAPNPLPSE